MKELYVTVRKTQPPIEPGRIISIEQIVDDRLANRIGGEGIVLYDSEETESRREKKRVIRKMIRVMRRDSDHYIIRVCLSGNFKEIKYK